MNTFLLQDCPLHKASQGTTCCHSPEERSPQMAQMCLVSDRAVPEGWAGTFITPLMPSGGLMSSVLLTEFIGEFS